MHFVAMLAFVLPMPMSYDVGLTVLSLMLAILATGGGFYVISRPGVSRPRLVLSGVFMGSPSLGMHYTGMAAMRGPVELSYDPLWVALSVIIAIGAATAALWLAFRTTDSGQKLAAAIVMGLAISGMHYTGMRAAICTAHATMRTPTRARPSIRPPWRWRSPVSCSPIWPPCSPPCPSASAPRRPCVRRGRILPISNGSPPWESWRPRFHMKSCSQSGRESPMPRRPCAGWAPSRQIWTRSGRRLVRAVKDGRRAVEIIGRIRTLIKKEPPRKDALEVNEAIVEVIALTRGEVMKNNVSVQTQLAEGLPLIQGDRVQLQQVILNLIINAVEAMSGVSEGSRGLLIGTGKDASGRVLVAVQDSGPGLNPESFERLFDSFYTTKPGGMGMGLSICRSIVEAHGGRIWPPPQGRARRKHSVHLAKRSRFGTGCLTSFDLRLDAEGVPRRNFRIPQ